MILTLASASGSAGAAPPIGVFLLLGAIGVLCIGLGVARMRGWNRTPLTSLPFEGLHFAVLPFGVAGLCALFGLATVHDVLWLAAALIVVSLASLALTVVGMFWWPPPLRPAWYRDWITAGRPGRAGRGSVPESWKGHRHAED